MSDDRPQELVDRAYGVGNFATAQPAAPVADRRGAIRALGIIQIGLGGLCGVMAAGMIAGAASVGRPSLRAFVLVLPTANLLLTGIGAAMIAPWARRANLISASIWLGLAVLLLGGMLAVATSGVGIGRSEIALVRVMMVPVLLLWLALPIVLIAVFTRPSVRAAFERRPA